MEEVTEGTEEVEAAPERDWEGEASAEGWAPEAQWKGDPKRWKSAEQFVRDGEKIVPILKSKVDRLDQRVEQLMESNKKLNEMSKRSLDKERRENDRLIKQLEEMRKQAVTNGDGEAFASADSQIQSLQQQGHPVPEQDNLDPLAEQWLSHNPWYAQDDRLGAFADGIADRLRARGYTGQAYFDELTRQVQETFPDEFENPNRKRASGVESGGEKTIVSNTKSFDSLPKDAKAAYQQFKRDIPGFTKEQFVEQYDWE
jgi:hypothetical protein